MKKLSVFLVCLILSGAGLHGAEQQALYDRPYSKLERDILNATTLEELQALSTHAEFSDAIDQLIQRGESPLILAITNGNLDAVQFFSSCCRGILKNEGSPTPFQLALKLSSMDKNEYTRLYPKSPDRRAILDLFMEDPQVVVQPINRNFWGRSEKGDERYKGAMDYLMKNSVVISNPTRFRCPLRKARYNYTYPQREWFSSGKSGERAYELDVQRYINIESGDCRRRARESVKAARAQ